ncbi:MAG: 3-dehydro-L-gulonate 2-dehydrogenase [Acidobacteriota bacterium]|nr:3-dehydro-L-gulonate 2-dehydrogenase [Acidobacteriota bacterium]
MMRIPFADTIQTLTSILIRNGFAPERAAACALLFAETTRDGVLTHGVARFPRFVATIRNGSVDPAAEPVRLTGFGALERWDGSKGPGNLNATAMMNRVIELSRAHGVGCVALRNTNHWMRGGTYGWQAAGAGFIGICWTNTMPNLPPWGGVERAIGNNPLVMGVPRKSGAVVLDMAMSQFSYGAIEKYRRNGELLPVDGGFDIAGNLTRNPAEIEESWRPLPAGLWKGSGLSIVLDVMAATLSLGNATHAISRDFLHETSLSQMFIAINPAALGGTEEAERIADEVVASVHACAPADAAKPVRYPGEETLRKREENARLGLPVDESLWQEILAL